MMAVARRGSQVLRVLYVPHPLGQMAFVRLRRGSVLENKDTRRPQLRGEIGPETCCVSVMVHFEQILRN
jgi:hypothetical protein